MGKEQESFEIRIEIGGIMETLVVARKKEVLQWAEYEVSWQASNLGTVWSEIDNSTLVWHSTGLIADHILNRIGQAIESHIA